MVNRPRLPNIDPEELSKLASQYPGSSAGERSEPTVGGANSSSGTSSSAPGDATPKDKDTAAVSPPPPTGGGDKASGGKADSDKASSDKAGSGAANGGKGRVGTGSDKTSISGDLRASGGAGSSSKPPQQKEQRRSRGGWFTAFVTFLFALTAVMAALISIGGPSYRAEIRLLLMKYAPQLEQDMVDLVTGYDPDRLEVTFNGLDERIGALTVALERVLAVEGLEPAAAQELLLKTEQNTRLSDVEERLAEQSAVIAAVPRQAEAIDALTAAQEAAAQSLRAALDEIRSELAAVRETIDGLTDGLAAGLTSVGSEVAALETADNEITARVAALDSRLQDLTLSMTALVDMGERVSQLVITRQDEELPVLALLQLEKALEGSGPYQQELAFARRYLGDSPSTQAAFEVLASSAPTGVNSLAELRRDFVLIANQMGSTVSRLQSWTDRVTSWFEMLVGASSVPEVLSGGQTASNIATIDVALDRGDLSLAVQEASAILATRRNGPLEEWLVALRKRHDIARALGILSNAVYDRGGSAGSQTTPQGSATGQAQGAGKTN